jgi:hypothetical protein
VALDNAAHATVTFEFGRRTVDQELSTQVCAMVLASGGDPLALHDEMERGYFPELLQICCNAGRDVVPS